MVAEYHQQLRLCFSRLPGRSSQKERRDGEVQPTRCRVESRGTAMPHDSSGQHA